MTVGQRQRHMDNDIAPMHVMYPWSSPLDQCLVRRVIIRIVFIQVNIILEEVMEPNKTLLYQESSCIRDIIEEQRTMILVWTIVKLLSLFMSKRNNGSA
jgi:hypothetical protein